MTTLGVTTRVFVPVRPVPVKVTVRGLPGALSVILTDPLRAPAAAGVKVTLSEHEPGLWLPVHPGDTVKSLPVCTMLVTFTGELPVKFSVNVWELLVVPIT